MQRKWDLKGWIDNDLSKILHIIFLMMSHYSYQLTGACVGASGQSGYGDDSYQTYYRQPRPYSYNSYYRGGGYNSDYQPRKCHLLSVHNVSIIIGNFNPIPKSGIFFVISSWLPRRRGTTIPKMVVGCWLNRWDKKNAIYLSG